MNHRRNIPILYAIALAQGMVFYTPIASLYRQAAGLNLTQIALIESISYVLTLAMELPWGVLADRIGYRRTMIASTLFFFLSKLIFWRAVDFGGFLLERVLLSAAIAGLSGVDESILYLSAGEVDSQRCFGRYSAFGNAGVLLAAVIYAAFIGENYRLAALATAVSYGLSLLLSLFIVEVRSEKQRERTTLKSFTACLLDTLRMRKLLALLLGLALYREAVQMATVWLNQNLYLRSGITSAGIGWVYMLIPLAALSGALSQRFTDALGEKRFASLAFLLTAAACTALALSRSAVLSVLCVTLVSAASALLGPLISLICNREVSAADRATQLSIFAVLQDVGASGANFGFGRIADSTLTGALLACAAASAAAWLCFLRFQKRG